MAQNFGRRILSLCLGLSIYVTGFSFSNVAQAGPSVFQLHQMRLREIQLQRLRSEPAYTQTKLLCQNAGLEYAKLVSYSAWEVFRAFGIFDARALIRMIDNRGIAPEVVALMESEAFQQALLDCGRVESTVNKMYVADVAGKAIGIPMALMMMRYGYPLMFRWLGRRSPRVQDATLILGTAYLAHQVLVLVETWAERQEKRKEVHDLIEVKSQELRDLVGSSSQVLNENIRREIQILESRLQNSNLNEPERMVIRSRIENLEGVLKLN
ncbi:MAG: hypothetical protein AB7K41_05265 [Bdellovibrionales bacterium]